MARLLITPDPAIAFALQADLVRRDLVERDEASGETGEYAHERDWSAEHSACVASLRAAAGHRGAHGFDNDAPEMRAAFIARQPIGRIGKAEEIAETDDGAGVSATFDGRVVGGALALGQVVARGRGVLVAPERVVAVGVLLVAQVVGRLVARRRAPLLGRLPPAPLRGSAAAHLV